MKLLVMYICGTMLTYRLPLDRNIIEDLAKGGVVTIHTTDEVIIINMSNVSSIKITF